jgi:hypothetical protein
MGCPTEVEIGDSLVFSVCTHDPDTGVLTDADSAPSYRVYEDETGTAILTGSMAKLDDANTAGFYTESIACTSANGFESGKTYTVYIAATVDSDTGGISYGFKAYDVRKADVTGLAATQRRLGASVAYDGATVKAALWVEEDGVRQASGYTLADVELWRADTDAQVADLGDDTTPSSDGVFYLSGTAAIATNTPCYIKATASKGGVDYSLQTGVVRPG